MQMKKNKTKLAERTCSSWCSGRRSAACLVWPGLVVASSEVRPPGQPTPSDRQDAWRPGRTSNPAIERQTQIHSASLLRLFIILMFGMGFRLLSALDFSEDVRGSETVQKLNNSAVFNPSVRSSLKANTITEFARFICFLQGGILRVSSYIYQGVKMSRWVLSDRLQKTKNERTRQDVFQMVKGSDAVKAKYVNTFTPLRAHNSLCNLMRPFVPNKRWPFLQQTALECDIWSKAVWIITKLSYYYLTVNGPRSHFLDYTDSTPLQETQNNMCSSGSSHAILHMATFKGFFFSTQALT